MGARKHWARRTPRKGYIWRLGRAIGTDDTHDDKQEDMRAFKYRDKRIRGQGDACRIALDTSLMQGSTHA